MGLTLTNHGIHDTSGASLKTTVDAITPLNLISGAGLYFIPLTGGQVQVISVDAS